MMEKIGVFGPSPDKRRVHIYLFIYIIAFGYKNRWAFRKLKNYGPHNTYISFQISQETMQNHLQKGFTFLTFQENQGISLHSPPIV